MEQIAASHTGVGLKSFTPIVLDDGRLRVEVLPELGAKISSLRLLSQGDELLQLPLLPYAERDRSMAFDAADASGFDECIPSVSACAIETADGPVHVPDHGDFWRLPFQCEQDGNQVRLEATGFSLPLKFVKKLALEPDGLHISYTVRNVGTSTCEFAWSAHPLFTVEAGDRIVLPPSVTSVQVEGSGKQRLTAGKHYGWPIAELAPGRTVDLSLAGSPDDEIGDKLFTDAPPEGWCALDRKHLGLRVAVHFDAVESPVLGLWLCYGGWPLDRPARQQCVALEPCMAAVDSLATAINKGWARRLAPGERARWSMVIQVTPLTAGK